MDGTAINILVLCTGNSCRSIMAEALLNKLGNDRFTAYSAGSQPAGYVHPQALACLNRNRVPVSHPSSKSWDDFIDTDLDLVITVCSNAANETCPVFPGAPLKTHWGLPDPAHASGSDAEVAEVFQQVFEALRDHIAAFVAACEAADVSDAAGLRAVIEDLGAPQVDIKV